MAVAAPKRKTAPAPAPSRTSPPRGKPRRARRRRRKAPARARAPARPRKAAPWPLRRRPRARPRRAKRPRAKLRPAKRPRVRRLLASAPARAPRRARTTSRAAAVGGQLIPFAGRTAVAVGQLPDSGLMVRMTRGRAWIAVLGVLLVGIVALNVVTLSFAASSGKIDAAITALDQENSILRGRDAQRSGVGPIRQAAGAARPGDAVQRRDPLHRGRPRRRRHGGAAARGRRRLGAGADALDRAPDRPPLRRLPALLPGHRRPRLLAAGGAGRRPRLRGDLPADRDRDRARAARQPARPPRQRARRLRGRGDDLRHALPGQEPAAGGEETGPDPRARQGARCWKA